MNFEEFNFHRQIAAGIAACGYTTPTPIQKEAIPSILAGAEIIVACPGRLLDLFNEGSINLGHIEVLILDEADHMFDKGFLPDIRRIVAQLPKKRQSLVFSLVSQDDKKMIAFRTPHSILRVNFLFYKISGLRKMNSIQ